jgi:hypothetical protein
MKQKQKHVPIVIAATCVLAVLGVGAVVVHAMQPKPKVVPGGSVSIHLNGVDNQFLNQITPVPSPQVSDPSYGGSSIQQSPQYGVDTWKTLLQDELQ